MPVKAKKQPTTANAKELQNKILSQKRNVVRQAFLMAGEDAVTYARDTVNTYLDQTGNLRSSIGFTLAENGVITQSSSFEQIPPKNPHKNDVYDGGERGREKSLQIVSENKTSDFILALVAGMKYAYYVERRFNLDVLSGAGLVMEKNLKDYLKVIK